MNPDPSFGPDEEHQWRIHREADWQRFAAPLSVVREIREAILVQILLGEDEHETYRQTFTEILKLESELLRLAMSHYPDWTANLLNLNHVRSWREVAEILEDQNRIALACKIRDLAALLRPAINKLYRNFDET